MGGVGRVTDTLCRELQRRSYHIFYLNIHWMDEERKNYEYPASVEMLPFPESEKDKNLIFYHQYLVEHKIDVVINQDALYVDFFNYTGNLPVKVISVIHNNPLINFNHLWNDLFTLRNDLFIEKLKRIARCLLFFRVKRQLRNYLQNRFRNIYAASDKIITLSPYYIDSMRKFGVVIDDKFDFIYNPNSYPLQNKGWEKKKEIIFVGRLDDRSKKISRLIKVWGKIWKDCPGWKLLIIGDGTDKQKLINMAKNHQVGNLSFEGFQNPEEYYKRASIICMTSSFEGFPMVLVEAMQFGCVPMAFDSFEAVRDVVVHEVTGILVKPFSIDRFASQLKRLINDETKRNVMADAAFKHVAQFAVKTIVDKWESLLKDLLGKNFKKCLEY